MSKKGRAIANSSRAKWKYFKGYDEKKPLLPVIGSNEIIKEKLAKPKLVGKTSGTEAEYRRISL